MCGRGCNKYGVPCLPKRLYVTLRLRFSSCISFDVFAVAFDNCACTFCLQLHFVFAVAYLTVPFDVCWRLQLRVTVAVDTYVCI